MLKIKMKRNLRRQILRGHPWIYKEAIELLGADQPTQMVEVIDKKNTLCWGYYDPYSPIAVRVISLEKKPPNRAYFTKMIDRAEGLRLRLFPDKATNCYRLINGEGDFLPGFVCDRYNKVAVIQFDGQGAEEFWLKQGVVEILLCLDWVETVYYKSRAGKDQSQVWGVPMETLATVKENSIEFLVNIIDGQKTGFFLDQRDNREYVRSISQNRSLLNLFSYTGGFSLYAASGGSPLVGSLDIAQSALELAEKSWTLNRFDQTSEHKSLAQDIFKYIAESEELWDMVVVDPPSLTHSEKNKELAVKKYIELFSQSLKVVKKEGDVFFSSCSSHISFDDFFTIITEALSNNRSRGQILRVSGQGSDHPFPHSCPELRYLKFVHVKLL